MLLLSTELHKHASTDTYLHRLRYRHRNTLQKVFLESMCLIISQ